VRRVIVCCKGYRDADLQLMAAKDDGAQIRVAQRTATFPTLGIELMFRDLTREGSEDQFRGYYLSGAIDEYKACERARAMLRAMVRP